MVGSSISVYFIQHICVTVLTSVLSCLLLPQNLQLVFFPQTPCCRTAESPGPFWWGHGKQQPQCPYFVKLEIKPCFRPDLECVFPEAGFCHMLFILNS